MFGRAPRAEHGVPSLRSALRLGLFDYLPKVRNDLLEGSGFAPIKLRNPLLNVKDLGPLLGEVLAKRPHANPRARPFERRGDLVELLQHINWQPKRD